MSITYIQSATRRVALTASATGNTALINAALAAMSNTGTLTMLPGTYVIDASVTIPTGIVLDMPKGVVLKPANGVELTINGQVKADLSQHFDLSLGGTIAGSMQNVEVYPEWWGAVGDGTTDDTIAIQKTIDSVSYTIIKFSAKTYLISKLNVKSNIIYSGSGKYTTVIKRRPTFSTDNYAEYTRKLSMFNAYTIDPAILSFQNIVFKDMTIDGNWQNLTVSSGTKLSRGMANNIYMTGVTNVLIDNCFITNALSTGILTYGCTNVKIRDCEISYCGTNQFPSIGMTRNGISIDGNYYIDNVSEEYVSTVTMDKTGNVVEGCYIHHNEQEGIQMAFLRDMLITKNEIAFNGDRAIEGDTSFVGGYEHNIEIVDNNIHDNKYGSISYSNEPKTLNFKCINNRIKNSGRYAVYVSCGNLHEGYKANIQIEGNEIDGVGQEIGIDTGTWRTLNLEGTNISVKNNKINNTFLVGCSISNCVNIDISNNDISMSPSGLRFGNSISSLNNYRTCTFTDSTDIVNKAGHNLVNGDAITFTSITTTTGISLLTTYYVISALADTFQVSASINGAAVVFGGGDGSGFYNVVKRMNISYSMEGAANTITKVAHGLLDNDKVIFNSINDAISCTFTDTGDYVGKTGHGLIEGERIMFTTVTTTTGVKISTPYYVKYVDADKFNVSLTSGGATLALTTNGTGTYRTMTNITSGISINTPYFVVGKTADTFQVALTLGGAAIDLVEVGAVTGTYTPIWTPVTETLVGTACTFTDSGDLVGKSAHAVQIGDTVIFDSITTTTGILPNVPYFVSWVDTNTFKVCSQNAFLQNRTCEFTDSGDTVLSYGHGLVNGDKVSFESISDTTGLMVSTPYWVVGKTTDTFQIASSQGGTALTLTTDGVGYYAVLPDVTLPLTTNGTGTYIVIKQSTILVDRISIKDNMMQGFQNACNSISSNVVIQQLDFNNNVVINSRGGLMYQQACIKTLNVNDNFMVDRTQPQYTADIIYNNYATTSKVNTLNYYRNKVEHSVSSVINRVAGVGALYSDIIRTGAATPIGAVTPYYIGEEYFDATGVKWYKATGLTNTDWVALN